MAELQNPTADAAACKVMDSLMAMKGHCKLVCDGKCASALHVLRIFRGERVG
jgi:hypothetical protein